MDASIQGKDTPEIGHEQVGESDFIPMASTWRRTDDTPVNSRSTKVSSPWKFLVSFNANNEQPWTWGFAQQGLPASQTKVNKLTNMAPRVLAIEPQGDLNFVLQKTFIQYDATIRFQPKHSTVEFHIRVSSQKLALVSSIFQAMLYRNFREARDLLKNGFVDVALPEDDVDAFTILMEVIHGQQVTLNINFPKLIQLAILVDKYALFKCTAPFSEEWLHESPVPPLANFNILSWLSVAWVFQDARAFDKVMKFVLIEMSKHSLKYQYLQAVERLPLPARCLGIWKSSLWILQN
jgi:hypothetical protein